MAEGSKGDTEDSWLGSAVSSPSLLASEIERDSWIALKKKNKAGTKAQKDELHELNQSMS